MNTRSSHRDYLPLRASHAAPYAAAKLGKNKLRSRNSSYTSTVPVTGAEKRAPRHAAAETYAQAPDTAAPPSAPSSSEGAKTPPTSPGAARESPVAAILAAAIACVEIYE